MKVELLITEDCPSCEKATAVWRAVCAERDVSFRPVYVHEPEGRVLVGRWRLSTIPALIIDGELMAVGVQSPEQAHELIDIAQTR